MKRFAKWGSVAVIVILLVCLLKCFNASLGFTANNGSECPFNFKDICSTSFVVLLASLRFLFLRMFWV